MKKEEEEEEGKKIRLDSIYRAILCSYCMISWQNLFTVQRRQHYISFSRNRIVSKFDAFSDITFQQNLFSTPSPSRPLSLSFQPFSTQYYHHLFAFFLKPYMVSYLTVRRIKFALVYLVFYVKAEYG